VFIAWLNINARHMVAAISLKATIWKREQAPAEVPPAQ
jgi:hypothetical protein